MDIKNWRRVVAIWGPLVWRMSVGDAFTQPRRPADAFVQPRRPPRRLHRLSAQPDGSDESWAAKNPEVLAFVCGGLFGLVPSASTFLAAPPDELARAITTVATTPIWTSGRWPFLGFIPVLGLAASGALAEFTTIRVLTASTVSFGLVSQASGRVVGELGTGWHITI
jgi:hypothetical protein